MWIALFAAWADCGATAVSEAAWVERLDGAEARFRELESEAFVEEMASLRDAVPCLGTALRPAQAARFHLLSGLADFVRNDVEAAKDDFGAAKAVDPTIKLPFATVPEGHEVHDLVVDAPVRDAVEALPPAATGALVFDGERSFERPVERVTVAQWLAADGRARVSRYLLPGEPMLPYEVAPEPVVGPEPRLPETAGRKWSGARVGLLAGTGVALAGSAALLSLAAVQADRVAGPHDPSVGYDDLKGYQRRANAFTATGGVLAGLGAGGLIGFVVVR